jgi:hypothetical protein
MADESLRYVIVHGEARFSRTEYICGRNWRSEYRNGPFLVGGDPNRPETMQLEFGPRRALIQNRDLGYQFDIDLESRVYTAFELHEYRRPGSFTPKVESNEPSGRTVHVRTETIDTGERKEMFGYTARRVTIRTTYRYSPDDDAASLDSERLVYRSTRRVACSSSSHPRTCDFPSSSRGSHRYAGTATGRGVDVVRASHAARLAEFQI